MENIKFSLLFLCLLISQIKGMESDNPKTKKKPDLYNLLELIKQENPDEIERLLESDIKYDLNIKAFGEYPIQTAARVGDLKIFELLIKHGANYSINSPVIGTPLDIAKKYQRIEIIQYIELQNAKQKLKKKINSDLRIYSQDGDFESIKETFKKYPDYIEINEQDTLGRTILHYASENGHHKIVDFLIKKGAKTDIKNCLGDTALYFASKRDRPKTVKKLMQSGSNPYSLTLRGTTLLKEIKEEFNSPKTIKLLSDNPDIQFRHAIIKGNISGIKELVRENEVKKLKINVRNKKDGKGPIHYAFKSKNRYNVILYLILIGANIDLSNKIDGNTPLHYAVLKKDNSSVRLLLNAGADYKKINRKKQTPCELATELYELTTKLNDKKSESYKKIAESLESFTLNDSLSKIPKASLRGSLALKDSYRYKTKKKPF